eukprot:527148-Hanusia_phi.AAC.2
MCHWRLSPPESDSYPSCRTMILSRRRRGGPARGHSVIGLGLGARVAAAPLRHRHAESPVLAADGPVSDPPRRVTDLTVPYLTQ